MEFMNELEGHVDLDRPDTIEYVQIEATVLLKIIKHSHESLPDSATGSLLGLDVSNQVEVTNCFAHPSEEGNDTSSYQLDMLKSLRTVGVDSNNIGWYSSVFFNSYFYGEETSFAQAWTKIIQGQYQYQSSIPNSLVLLYDPIASSSQGELSLRAFRLSDAFMQLYKKCSGNYSENLPSISKDDFLSFNVGSGDIFQEVSVKVHNSLLVHAFLYEIRDKAELCVNEQCLKLNAHEGLGKSMNRLGEAIDEYVSEQNTYFYHQREIQRRAQKQENYLQKHAIEKDSKQFAELVASHPLFRPVPPVDRLNTFLVAGQFREFVDTIESNANLELAKLYCVKGF